jgi:hypothetical protein
MSKIKKLIKVFIPPLFYPNNINNFIRENFYKEKNFFDFENTHHNRISLISFACKKYNLKKCKYLEIGVFDNEVFNAIPLLSENKIGVDPEKGGTHKMTSDIFFKNNLKKFDIIFIDGLHHYEQVFVDFNNSLKFLKEDGIIFIHDMLPKNSMEENIKNHNINSWTGDVWKLGVEMQYDKRFKFVIANIDHGVGIVKKPTKVNYMTRNKNLNIAEKKYEDYKNKYFRKLPIVNCSEAIDFILSK